jgi:hypothetical protein
VCAPREYTWDYTIYGFASRVATLETYAPSSGTAARGSNPVASFACLGTPNEKSPERRFFIWCAIVEEVRTIFERRNDATIYIPSFYPTPEITTSTSSVAF